MHSVECLGIAVQEPGRCEESNFVRHIFQLVIQQPYHPPTQLG